MNPNKALWEKGDFTRIARTMRRAVHRTEPEPQRHLLDSGHVSARDRLGL